LYPIHSFKIFFFIFCIIYPIFDHSAGAAVAVSIAVVCVIGAAAGESTRKQPKEPFDFIPEQAKK